jgi:hypothetical protein
MCVIIIHSLKQHFIKRLVFLYLSGSAGLDGVYPAPPASALR